MNVNLKEEIDRQLDAVLKATGSGLKYYTLPKSLEEARRAVFNTMMFYCPDKKAFEKIFEEKHERKNYTAYARSNCADIGTVRYLSWTGVFIVSLIEIERMLKNNDKAPLPKMVLCACCKQAPKLIPNCRKWRVVCMCGNAVKPKSTNKTRAIYDWNVMNALLKEKDDSSKKRHT